MAARALDDATWSSTSLVTPDEVLTQALPDDELIFLDLRNESYFGLDAVGARMYTAVTKSDTMDAAFERLAADFDVDRDRLREDLRRFVERLMDRGLLEVRA